jgi:hypothetical protein
VGISHGFDQAQPSFETSVRIVESRSLTKRSSNAVSVK